MPTPSSIGQLRSLTGLRWLAALLVFAYHVHVIHYFRDGAAGTVIGWLFGAGVTGVSFFFVLSGFVLAWSARDGDRPRRFWLRRIARIYPVHVVCGIAALLLLWIQSPRLLPKADALLANLFLVHAWVPAGRFNQSLDPVSWSLACEAFFYALFPVIFALLRRAGIRTMWTVAGVAAGAVFVVPFFVSGAAMHYVPLARLGEFVLGMALACLVRAARLRGPGFGVALVVTAVGYWLASTVHTPHRYAACTLLGFAMLITTAAVADVDSRPSTLRHRWFVRLGELSFAFYMVHILVTRAAEFFIPHRPYFPPGRAAVVVTILFGVSLALSWMLYEWVEHPGKRLILGWRRAGVSAPVPPRDEPLTGTSPHTGLSTAV